MSKQKILLDINIVMDLLLARQPFAEEAKKIFQKAIEGEIEVYITNCSIVTIIYFMEKNAGHIKTRATIKNFLQISKTIDVKTTDILKAFSINDITDTEDAIQMQAAIKYGMDYILTRDKKFSAVSNPKVPVMSPSKYLSILEQAHE